MKFDLEDILRYAMLCCLHCREGVEIGVDGKGVNELCSGVDKPKKKFSSVGMGDTPKAPLM